jgi:hypothetical protein
MALRDGSYSIRLQLEDGRLLENSTDDLTLLQIDTAERACGIAWPFMDPTRNMRTAIALFAVLLIADGEDEDKALQLAGEMKGRQLRGAFTWNPPEDPLPATGGEPTDPPA